MAHIVWDEKMSVLVRQMDDEHKKLIEIINNFYESMGGDNSKAQIQAVIKSMKEYTVFHFSDEERLMQKHGYVGLEQHKQEHKAFIEKVKDMENRYSQGKLLLSLEVANFLKTWLTNHIMQSDKKYGEYLRTLGVS